MTATRHFRERLAQRVSPEICADMLAAEIIRGIAEDRTDFVRFACRSKTGSPVYRIHLEQFGTLYVVVSPTLTRILTIIGPGNMLARGGKRKPKRLRA